MGRNSKFRQYFREYRWSNIAAMIRNNRAEPKICDADFTGRLVVITGATSGIGYAVARKYASRGADLLCINRNPEKSESLRIEIEKEFGVVSEQMLADILVFLKEWFISHITKEDKALGEFVRTQAMSG